MQREEIISLKNIDIIINAIFADATPVIYEAYSKFGKNLILLDNFEDLSTYIQKAILNNEFVHLAIYYPETSGILVTEKIKVDSKISNEQKFRFSIGGWGLIYLQLDFKTLDKVNCRFAVNSEKRANKWFETYPDWKSPEIWNWKIVEKRSRKLISTLKKCANLDIK